MQEFAFKQRLGKSQGESIYTDKTGKYYSIKSICRWNLNRSRGGICEATYKLSLFIIFLE